MQIGGDAMKMLRTAFALLCMSSCVAAGCTKCEPQTLSPEAAACREQISTFGLIRAGGTDEEAWQAMVKGL